MGYFYCIYSCNMYCIILTDIDECQSDPCRNNGTCNDQIDIFNCTCKAGFTGFLCDIGKEHSQKCSVRNNSTKLIMSYKIWCFLNLIWNHFLWVFFIHKKTTPKYLDVYKQFLQLARHDLPYVSIWWDDKMLNQLSLIARYICLSCCVNGRWLSVTTLNLTMVSITFSFSDEN